MGLEVSSLEALKLTRTRTPLWVFLYLYSQAEYECYETYQRGALDLLSFLTSRGTVPLDYQEHLYPEINDTGYKVPELMVGYSSSRLSAIISDFYNPRTGDNIQVWLMDTAKTDRAIHITMLRKVLPLLYSYKG